jgi:hypothetical protein
VWDLLIRARQLTRVTPLLEGVLSRVSGAKTCEGDAVSAESSPDALTQITLG